MSTPEDAFSRLSLGNYLAFDDPRCDLSHRRHEVWDILSSFDKSTFAAEFRLADWNKVADPQRNSALTIPGDLEGTMLYRGCHDAAAWQALNKSLPSSVRAKMFSEKLSRRFSEQFQKFDGLQHTVRGGNEVRRKLEDILRAFRYLARIGRKDLMKRREGKATSIIVLLKVLRDVCEDQTTIPSLQGSSIYHQLIRNAASDQEMFILDALEAVNFTDPSWTTTTDDLREMAHQLQRIEAALRSRSAPSRYISSTRSITNAVQARAPRRRGT